MNIDQENTARRLKDEPLFATRQWWCRLGIHIWHQWSQPTKAGIHSFDVQYRTCGFCGRAELRKVGFNGKSKK
jgi:hypothetical protein